MKKRAGVIRLLAVFVIGLVLVAYQLQTVLGTAQSVASFSEKTATQTEIPERTENGTTGLAEETPSTETETKTQGKTAETKSSGTVKGKVIERTISPYNAGLSYGKVTLKNSTDLSVDLRKLLIEDLKLRMQKTGKPQVLIMHTHTTETFMETASSTYTDADLPRTRDASKNMVSVGDIVAQKLNEAGIITLHDTTEHDYPQYTGSYSRAASTIKAYLKKYPDIKVVLDLHRDSVSSGSDKVKLTAQIDGKKAAQVMLVMGSQSGSVSGFPNWKENLKLAVRLQEILESQYPSLARPISLTSKKYNENLTTGSLLIEVGTEANTLEEAHYSAALLGNALCQLLGKLEEK